MATRELANRGYATRKARSHKRQFPEHRSYKFLIPGLMKPLHFAGGQGQLGWTFGQFEPGTHVQDTRVGIAASKGPQSSDDDPARVASVETQGATK